MVKHRKRSVLAFAAAVLSAGAANAAGPFDGIYQVNPNFFFSVHQGTVSGKPRVFVSIFQSARTAPATNAVLTIGSFRPELLSYWELLGGDINAVTGVATVSGAVQFGFCDATYTIKLVNANNDLSYRLTSIAPTPLGTSQGYSCGQSIQADFTTVRLL